MRMPFIVGIGGTTRQMSSSEKALRFALGCAAEAGADTEMFSAGQLDLPMYGPEVRHRSASARWLVEQLKRADGVIVSSPGYHGGVSGLIKNALDYAEDLRDHSRPYLDGCAFGTIAVANGWAATMHTITGLRSIAHALRAWPTPMAAALNTAEGPFDDDGRIVDPKARQQLELVGRQVVEFAEMRLALESTQISSERRDQSRYIVRVAKASA
jgi:FMN reductase